MSNVLLEIFGAILVVLIISEWQQGSAGYLDSASPTPRAANLFFTMAIVFAPSWIPAELFIAPERSLFGEYVRHGWVGVLAIGALVGIVRSPIR